MKTLDTMIMTNSVEIQSRTDPESIDQQPTGSLQNSVAQAKMVDVNGEIISITSAIRQVGKSMNDDAIQDGNPIIVILAIIQRLPMELTNSNQPTRTLSPPKRRI